MKQQLPQPWLFIAQVLAIIFVVACIIGLCAWIYWAWYGVAEGIHQLTGISHWIAIIMVIAAFMLFHGEVLSTLMTGIFLIFGFYSVITYWGWGWYWALALYMPGILIYTIILAIVGGVLFASAVNQFAKGKQ